jgi:hypothetical protein
MIKVSTRAAIALLFSKEKSILYSHSILVPKTDLKELNLHFEICIMEFRYESVYVVYRYVTVTDKGAFYIDLEFENAGAVKIKILTAKHKIYKVINSKGEVVDINPEVLY